MWIKRFFEDKIKPIQRPVLILTGARQVGKSSLLKKIFSDFTYVSLDLPSDAELAAKDPETFLRLYPPPLIIDEIQYAPEIFRFIKKKVDEDTDKKLSYVLTGSQKFQLMKNVKESLAGRAEVIDLLPLALSEIEHLLQLSWSDLMIRGGYPELIANSGLDSFEYFRSYTRTYLERDIKDILNVQSLRDFERFLRACAFRTSNLLNKSDLARDVGISPTTANEWLSVLQTSNQIYLLEPWFTNKSKSITKSPKLYFMDTGLLCFLLNIRSENILQASPLRGAIWENYVFQEIYKALNLTDLTGALYFYRDRDQEVDFVVNQGGIADFIEAKWSAYPDQSDFKNMLTLNQLGYFKNKSKTVIGPIQKSFPLRSTDIYARSPSDIKKLFAGPLGQTLKSDD